MNIEFHYLYRDEGNYKNHNSVIFSNTENLNLENVENEIRKYLISDTWFEVGKWNLKNIQFEDDIYSTDLTWHEYNYIDETSDTAMNGDIVEFLNLIQKVKDQ